MPRETKQNVRPPRPLASISLARPRSPAPEYIWPPQGPACSGFRPHPVSLVVEVPHSLVLLHTQPQRREHAHADRATAAHPIVLLRRHLLELRRVQGSESARVARRSELSKCGKQWRASDTVDSVVDPAQQALSPPYRGAVDTGAPLTPPRRPLPRYKGIAEWLGGRGRGVFFFTSSFQTNFAAHGFIYT